MNLETLDIPQRTPVEFTASASTTPPDNTPVTSGTYAGATDGGGGIHSRDVRISDRLKSLIADRRQGIPTPDLNFMQKSLEEFRDGKWKSAREIADELRSRYPRSNATED